MTSKELQKKYNLPVYRTWAQVPEHLYTKSALYFKHIKLPKDALPDAIKNASGQIQKDKIFFLYDINKYS